MSRFARSHILPLLLDAARLHKGDAVEYIGGLILGSSAAYTELLIFFATARRLILYGFA